jgi:cyclohexadieny/prephenate dehydrogenase
MSEPLFRRMALIGLGLIGSSLARVVKREGLAGHIAGTARSQATRDKAMELGFLDSVHETPGAAVAGADLVVLCSPLGTYSGRRYATIWQQVPSSAMWARSSRR